MATSTWSVWGAVFRPLVIGIGAGLIVALLLYILGVSCVWLWKLKVKWAIAGGLDVENRGANDASAEGTGHPGGLPSDRVVPNGGVEGLSLHAAHAHATGWLEFLEMGTRKGIAEVGVSADQLLVSANVPKEELEA